MIANPFPSLERDAVLAGVRAADNAIERFRRFEVLILFERIMHLPIANPKLRALRVYAELRRALLPRGFIIPSTSLSKAGFTANQITRFDALIRHGLPTDEI